jgi:hypothetical protein
MEFTEQESTDLEDLGFEQFESSFILDDGKIVVEKNSDSDYAVTFDIGVETDFCNFDSFDKVVGAVEDAIFEMDSEDDDFYEEDFDDESDEELDEDEEEDEEESE